MRSVRTLQWLGVAIVATSAFWPALHVRAYPTHPRAPDGPAWVAAIGSGLREIPAHELGTAIVESLQGPDGAGPLWDARRWYPWYLSLAWAIALLASIQGGASRRRLVGGVVLLSSLGIVAFEAAYLRAEYAAFLPGALGRAEVACAWIFVTACLLYRRAGDRHLGAVEAAIAGQALLGFVHGLTLPATMFRQWLPGRHAGSVLGAVLENFAPAFWIGMLGLLLVALPVYLRRAGPGDRAREEGG